MMGIDALEERHSDERALKMVRMRAEGISPAKIGRAIGMSPQFVSTATLRVLNADIEKSGELESDVRAGYW